MMVMVGRLAQRQVKDVCELPGKLVSTALSSRQVCGLVMDVVLSASKQVQKVFSFSVSNAMDSSTGLLLPLQSVMQRSPYHWHLGLWLCWEDSSFSLYFLWAVLMVFLRSYRLQVSGFPYLKAVVRALSFACSSGLVQGFWLGYIQMLGLGHRVINSLPDVAHNRVCIHVYVSIHCVYKHLPV